MRVSNQFSPALQGCIDILHAHRRMRWYFCSSCEQRCQFREDRGASTRHQTHVEGSLSFILSCKLFSEIWAMSGLMQPLSWLWTYGVPNADLISSTLLSHEVKFCFFKFSERLSRMDQKSELAAAYSTAGLDCP